MLTLGLLVIRHVALAAQVICSGWHWFWSAPTPVRMEFPYLPRPPSGHQRQRRRKEKLDTEHFHYRWPGGRDAMVDKRNHRYAPRRLCRLSFGSQVYRSRPLPFRWVCANDKARRNGERIEQG